MMKAILEHKGFSVLNSDYRTYCQITTIFINMMSDDCLKSDILLISDYLIFCVYWFVCLLISESQIYVYNIISFPNKLFWHNHFRNGLFLSFRLVK